jgi:hypothetical protein
VNAVIKPKKCRICRRPFTPHLTTQVCCSSHCAIQYARFSGEKRQSAAMKRVAIAEKREAKEALKTRRDWLREAQAVFNAWVRERDFNMPCISCDVSTSTWNRGGYFDSGHYRSVGACPELRFEPLNCAKQCKRCNRDLSGNVVEFRLGLLRRIGAELVDWLEGPHESKKHTVDELREIIRSCRLKTKELREKREARAAA